MTEDRDYAVENRLTTLEVTVNDLKTTIDKFKPMLYSSGVISPIVTGIIVWYFTKR